MVVCLEQDADLHMAQLMPLPLTVSCFSRIQIGFTFLVLAYLGNQIKSFYSLIKYKYVLHMTVHELDEKAIKLLQLPKKQNINQE